MTTRPFVGTGRNDACPCGSGRKLKACCGRLQAVTADDAPHGRPPDEAVAQLNAGNALARSGRMAEAERRFRRALELAPDLAEAHNSLGVLHLELGRHDLAVEACRRAVQLRPEFAAALGSLARALIGLHRLEEALHQGRRALELDPQCADLHDAVGTALLQAGRLAEAIPCFRRALRLEPEFAEAHLNLANALRGLGRLDDAAAECRRALDLRPHFVAAHASLGTVLRLQRRGAEAEASCRTALDLAPDSIETLGVLAELQADQGRFTEAEGLYRRAVAIDPGSVESWAALVRLRKMTPGDTAWLVAARDLLKRGLEPPREMTLRFALGKYFDDLGRHAEAFEHYRLANVLARDCGPAHDRASLSNAVDLLVRSHTHSWFSAMRAAAQPSERPVFIVGMLRSGTSLAEQILASHPAVFGAGELSFWGPETAPAIAGRLACGTAALELTPAGLRELGDAYLACLDRCAADAPDALRVVDKLPTNFLFLGLIHAAFPRARILHLQRNPLDTCLSIYFQRFEAANTYANDLGDLAHYYREYRRLMRHWEDVLPAGTVLGVPYEGLVEAPAVWSRRMVEFIGLPWDPRCLDCHLTDRAVVTASRWQVRQKINPGSVGRWRHYERFLGPLLACLEGPPADGQPGLSRP